MAKVVPTVLAETPEQYASMFERASGLSNRVHVDICDGIFADNTTIGLAQVNVEEGVELDLHLMLKEPQAQLETALSLKPNLIILHAESEGDIAAMIEQIRSLGIKAGVALLPETKVEQAAELIRAADHALIFTGTLGHNGGKFQTDQLTKAVEIRNQKPDIEIGVDGGVTDKNAALISLQGVDVLYVGGFLQSAEDPQAALAEIDNQVGIKK